MMPDGCPKADWKYRPTTEEIEGEHVEEQVPPASMDQSVTEHPIPLPSVPNVVCIKLQGIDIQHPHEAKDADRRGDQDENQRHHLIEE